MSNEVCSLLTTGTSHVNLTLKEEHDLKQCKDPDGEILNNPTSVMTAMLTVVFLIYFITFISNKLRTVIKLLAGVTLVSTFIVGGGFALRTLNTNREVLRVEKAISMNQNYYKANPNDNLKAEHIKELVKTQENRKASASVFTYSLLLFLSSFIVLKRV